MADLNDIKLSSQDILKKQFRTKMKGYDPEEVDQYLDKIISDYNVYNQIIEDLYGKIGKLQHVIMEQKKNSSNTTSRSPQHSQETVTSSNQQDDVKRYVPHYNQPSPQQSAVQGQIQNNSTQMQDDNELSTNMELIQRVSTLERKVYNLEQRVYGFQNR